MVISTVVGNPERRIVFAHSDDGSTRATYLRDDKKPVHIPLSPIDVKALCLWAQDVKLLEDDEDADAVSV